MKYWMLLTTLLASVSFAADPPGADDGMGGDLGGSGSGQQVDWFPVIRSFYVEPYIKGENVNRAPLKLQPFDTTNLPSDLLQWNALKAVIERPKDANGQPNPYGPEDQIVAGWKYRVDAKDGNPTGTTGYDVKIADKTKAIQVLLADAGFRIMAEVDVIMTDTPEGKKEKLKKYFTFAEEDVSAWPVNASLKGVRDPIGPEALAAYRAPVKDAPDQLFVNVKPTAVIQPHFLNETDGINFPASWDYTTHGVGVWEFRIKIGVSGRVTESERPTIKFADGTIRVAFLDNSQWDFKPLSFQGQRKAGEVDEYIIGADGKIYLKPKPTK